MIQHWRKFIDISANYIRLAHFQYGRQKLHKGDTACFGSPRTREDRGIQAIQIYGEIYRNSGYLQLIYKFGKPIELEWMYIGMVFCKFKFCFFTAADTELMDPSVSDKIMAPSNDAGMT